MKDKEWIKILAEQEASGESAIDFCRQRGISPKTLSYQKWKLKQSRQLQPPPRSQFVRVGEELRFEVVLTNGAVVRAPLSALQEILEALK